MLKILLKAAVLFFIVVSVYLIVNPHACSNMLAGRERVEPAVGVGAEWRHPMEEPGRTLEPAPEKQAPADEMLDEKPAAEKAADASNEATQKDYSQADIDYAIASRYVELEREYDADKQIGKDISQKIASTVMEDFEMTADEWNAFLARAVSSGLFEKVRQEQAAAATEKPAEKPAEQPAAPSTEPAK
ncbi:MAG: hypothetical protein J6U96_00180 [Elusimicrobiaceae bacterium]|nr:hypothetical protein [Elusimicrobiaceae bacterium]